MSQVHSESTSKAECIAKKSRILKIRDKDERQKEIAYWVIETLWDIKLKVSPTPPKDYLAFNAASPHDQKKAIEGGFYQNEEIEKYTNAKSSAKNENHSNIAWLTEVKEWLPAGDVVSRGKIDAKLDEISGGKFKQTKPVQVDWNN